MKQKEDHVLFIWRDMSKSRRECTRETKIKSRGKCKEKCLAIVDFMFSWYFMFLIFIYAHLLLFIIFRISVWCIQNLINQMVCLFSVMFVSSSSSHSLRLHLSSILWSVSPFLAFFYFLFLPWSISDPLDSFSRNIKKILVPLPIGV